MPIHTNVVSSNPTQAEYLIQHYVIKFVSDLGRVLRFPPQIKLTQQYNWNIVESGVKHLNPTLILC
jgi:hypothetical protein